jgi:hypothetical protein
VLLIKYSELFYSFDFCIMDKTMTFSHAMAPALLRLLVYPALSVTVMSLLLPGHLHYVLLWNSLIYFFCYWRASKSIYQSKVFSLEDNNWLGGLKKGASLYKYALILQLE